MLASHAALAQAGWTGGGGGGGGGSAAKVVNITVQTGFSSQAFSGVTGATFSRLSRMTFGASASFRWKKWENGIHFSMMMPSATISPFTLTTNESGSQSLSFQNYEFFTGAYFSPVRVQFIFGFEKSSVSGTPALGYTGGMSRRMGGAIWWDFYRIFPVGFQIGEKVILHGARDFKFANYPNDTMSVSSGLELDTILGVYYEF